MCTSFLKIKHNRTLLRFISLYRRTRVPVARSCEALVRNGSLTLQSREPPSLYYSPIHVICRDLRLLAVVVHRPEVPSRVHRKDRAAAPEPGLRDLDFGRQACTLPISLSGKFHGHTHTQQMDFMWVQSQTRHINTSTKLSSGIRWDEPSYMVSPIADTLDADHVHDVLQVWHQDASCGIRDLLVLVLKKKTSAEGSRNAIDNEFSLCFHMFFTSDVIFPVFEHSSMGPEDPKICCFSIPSHRICDRWRTSPSGTRRR